MSHKQAQTILYRHNTLTVTPAYTLTRDAITLMSYTCRIVVCLTVKKKLSNGSHVWDLDSYPFLSYRPN
jgi:hypothetical protein